MSRNDKKPDGFGEEAQAYSAGPHQPKPLDNAMLDRLTAECSQTVKAAIDAHHAAGRPVFTQSATGPVEVVKPPR